MKIIFIASKYDYGKPELGYSYEYYNLYDSLVRMNNKEHDVIFFPFDEIMAKKGKKEMNNELLDIVSKEKPNLCFFFLSKDEIEKGTIKKITSSGVITFNWFADDKWRFENFSKYWAPLFSWISTDQPVRVKDYSKIGYKNVVVGGWACNENIHKYLNLPKIYDVSFVGQSHGDRKNIVEEIKKAGIKIECFGRGWPNGKISQEEMIKVFNQSKINLNFSKCSGGFGLKYIAGIFVNKNEKGKLIINDYRSWLPNFKSFLARGQNEIKGRNFEIPGCRAFLLTGYAKGLEDYYTIGKEIACFYSNKDLIKKIKYYLNNQGGREKIALAGYERTISSYTYEKIFNKIFEIIKVL